MSETNSRRSNSKVNIALFGAGRIGTVHLKSIARHPRTKLKWLVEEDRNCAEVVLEDVGLEDATIITFKEVTKVLSDDSVVGILVCTPTPTHQKIIVQALHAGKAVFCEKPVAHTSTAAAECYTVAEECGRPLFCAFNKRFDPSFGSVIKRANAGDVGQVRYIKTTFRDTLDPDFKGYSMLGSIFVDLALHDVDLACQVIGELPVTVSADGHAFNQMIADNNDFDQAVVTLKFPSGAIATIELSRFCNYGYDQRLEVFGTDGMLESYNIHGSQMTCSNSHGISKQPLLPSFPERFEQAYYNELDHFIKVIEGTDQLCVTKEEGIAAIRITEECENAAKTHAIVTMKW